MEKVYIICMIVGFLLLSLSVLGEFLENVAGAFEFVLHADTDFDFAFLPLSGVSVCGGLIAFGGVGMLFKNPIIAAVLAYAAAMAVQTVVRRLKKVRNEAMEREELFLCDGRIINTVLPGGLGTVEFENIKGYSTTFVCRGQDRGEEIKQNTEVRLVDFDGEVAVVRKKDEFAEYAAADREK